MQAQIDKVVRGFVSAESLGEDLLVSILEELNSRYRAGDPLVSNEVYDGVFIEALRALNPDHPFLNTVEPEPEDAFGDLPSVRHAKPMLSTDKAYHQFEVSAFVRRVEKVASEVGENSVTFRVTPKLDGMACHDDGNLLATRGNGLQGRDVSRALGRGLAFMGSRGEGPGEIVVEQSFFESVLKAEYGFDHPRNFIAGFCGADSVKPHHAIAAKAGHVVFYSFANLPSFEVSGAELVERHAEIVEQVKSMVPYLTDGAVVEVSSPDVKAAMGATKRHHRWMLALKESDEAVFTGVRCLTWQTGRTGQITPVAELEPVQLPGCVATRATVHHAGKVVVDGIDAGAVVGVIRAGKVIPKIVSVAKPSVVVDVPETCPSCGHSTYWSDAFLMCSNTLTCEAQVTTRLRHFFKTLGSAKLFGDATLALLVDFGAKTVEDIYGLTEADLMKAGLGPGQAANCHSELYRSFGTPVEDWRWLAAFGIRHLGRGDSENLLMYFTIEDLVNGGVSAADIQQVPNFGVKTSVAIEHGLDLMRPMMQRMLPRFSLIRTPATGQATASDSPVSGRSFVFTGAMQEGSRDDMKALVKHHGGKAQSSVSGKTDYLVCGEGVGQSKIDKATSLGVAIISESEFRAMVKGDDDA